LQQESQEQRKLKQPQEHWKENAHKEQQDHATSTDKQKKMESKIPEDGNQKKKATYPLPSK